MLTIDADAHVIECEKTWDYLEGDDKRYRPVPIAVDMPAGKKQNFWIIGGRLIGGRDNIGQDTSKESREMANIDSRLKHMDEIGTGVQVLYPTLFLRPVTDNPRIELALCRSYNRWMADIWSKDKKRLRWAVQLPLMSMDQALDELRWSHGNGACAVFMRGIETHHTLHDPYFFPLYEEASRLNMPIGIHSSRQADRDRRLSLDDSQRHPGKISQAAHRRHRSRRPMGTLFSARFEFAFSQARKKTGAP